MGAAYVRIHMQEADEHEAMALLHIKKGRAALAANRIDDASCYLRGARECRKMAAWFRSCCGFGAVHDGFAEILHRHSRVA